MTRVQSQPATLTSEQFKFISEIAYKEAGLVLVETKSSMISARLSKRVRSLNLDGLEAYFDLLKSEKIKDEISNLLSVLTTNVSHFFREEHHFEILKKEIIPGLKERAKQGEKIRIWSAGCSNGQEIYSIIMTFIEEFSDLENFDVKFLASDIDPSVIQTGISGTYTPSQLKGISDERIKKFFTQNIDNSGMTIKEEVRQKANFRILNLISDWPMKFKFDVIFCRNVVIYFDEATQKKLWQRFEEMLKPDAWLFLGHSERVQCLSDQKLYTAGITAYRKKPTGLEKKEKEQDKKTWH